MFKRNENSTLEEFLSKAKKGFAQAGVFMIAMLVLTGGLTLVLQHQVWSLTQPGHVTMERFDTCSGIIDAFNNSSNYGGLYIDFGNGLAVPMAAESQAIGSGGSKAGDFSTTNIQVEGVDEADIVKTDGEYIYTVSGRKLVIIRAWPAGDAEVISETDLEEFSPNEMLIKDDIIMLFGYTREVSEYPEPKYTEASSGQEVASRIASPDYYYPYYHYRSFMTVQLWDVSDREDPEKVRKVDFEGNYLTSRMIGDDVYFVINSYPRMYGEPDNPVDILPVYRDSVSGDEVVPVCGCASVGYFEPGYARSFITLASMSISDPDADVEKEVVVGSGENIYASQENIYIAEYNYFPRWGGIVPLMEAAAGTDYVFEEPTETTVVHKFSMDNGEIGYLSNANVPGRVLNQFSMDESEGYFRIATTIGRVSKMGGASTNNIYVYDSDMELEGKLENLAPGEQIYSARFMGDRGYLVTFKKIDPLFVIDLSDPSSPDVLGKLKIPGYSDYLHPYDENHIIGIGKDSIEAEGRDFSWHQGVKMALFDVSDVENPKELHKVVIGDRGTDSYALHDHKAFLFDMEKELLVLPILLAEIKGDPEDLPDWSYGDYVYQGAYVYSLNPDDGFDLKGRITHYDDDELFRKSGYYFYGDTYSVKRAGYLEDTLWTFSNNRLKLNDLDSLDEIATLDFGDPTGS